MTAKHYKILAEVAGKALAAAYLRGGEEARTITYNEVYCPLTSALALDNPNFDTLRFGGFASAIETVALSRARPQERYADHCPS